MTVFLVLLWGAIIGALAARASHGGRCWPSHSWL